MPIELAVALIGIGGIIAGAVATHVLQRSRSGEAIRKTGEQRLRGMLEAELQHGLRERLIALLMAHRMGAEGRLLGYHEISDELKRRVGRGPGSRIGWQPHRIGDPKLQEMAHRYYELRARLYVLLIDAPTNREEFVESVSQVEEQFEELDQQITLRMDELNWPELDE